MKTGGDLLWRMGAAVLLLAAFVFICRAVAMVVAVVFG